MLNPILTVGQRMQDRPAETDSASSEADGFQYVSPTPDATIYKHIHPLQDLGAMDVNLQQGQNRGLGRVNRPPPVVGNVNARTTFGQGSFGILG